MKRALHHRYGHSAEPFRAWRYRVVSALANRFVADGMEMRTATLVAQGIVERARRLKEMHRKGIAAVVAADRVRSQ